MRDCTAAFGFALQLLQLSQLQWQFSGRSSSYTEDYCCRSIKAFADKYHELNLPLHMLINNAGVFLVNHDHTQEGFEVQMQLGGCCYVMFSSAFCPRCSWDSAVLFLTDNWMTIKRLAWW